MAKKRQGVKARTKSVQIWFMLDGKRRWETLDWSPNETNLDRAARLRRRIVSEIELDVFDYVATFPNSKHAPAKTSPLFFDIASKYLDQYRDRTRYDYKSALNRTWPTLFEMPVNTITFQHLFDAVQPLNSKSPKYYNNELIPMRGVFKLAEKLELITIDPSSKLLSRKEIKVDPDPFSRTETETIIDYFYSHYGVEYGAYFEFAFFTGMRNPSEIIALNWSHVVERSARIAQRRSRGKLVQGTKTGVIRDVYLNDRALKAVKAMMGKNETTIFINPNSGNPFLHGDVLNDKWRSALAILGIRHRRMYNTRHTCATMMLENGVNPAVAADQLGHSLKMFFEVYAKWINASKRDEELRKMNNNVAESVAKPTLITHKSLNLK